MRREDETSLTEYVYYELSYTIDSQSKHERWRQIKQNGDNKMQGNRCIQSGQSKTNQGGIPILVRCRIHPDQQKTSSMGVYADKAYTSEVEARDAC